MTTSRTATRAAAASSILEICRFMPESTLEAPALGDEDACGTPLQEEDDHPEHEYLSEHRVEKDLLERLIDDPDAQGADHSADNVADASDDNGHEAIDDIALAEAGTDIADLREEGAGQSSKAAAQAEGEHIH